MNLLYFLNRSDGSLDRTIKLFRRSTYVLLRGLQPLPARAAALARAGCKYSKLPCTGTLRFLILPALILF